MLICGKKYNLLLRNCQSITLHKCKYPYQRQRMSRILKSGHSLPCANSKALRVLVVTAWFTSFAIYFLSKVW